MTIPIVVLVVDDDPGIRESLARELTAAGYATLTAADGREALAIAGSGPRRALENFFRTEMLVRLRELALLQTATYSTSERTSRPTEKTTDVRLAVAMPFDPEVARPLILRGSRLAGRMNTRWFALYVRKMREHPKNISAAEHRRLTENVQLAMSLGATVVTRETEDVVHAILHFVSEESINMLVVGRLRRRGLFRRIAGSVGHELIDNAPGVDIVVVDVDEEE